MCAVGDLHTCRPQHESAPEVFHTLPTQLLCAAQSKDLDIGDPHNVLDTFPTPFKDQKHTPGTSLCAKTQCRLSVKAPVRKNFSGTDKSPRNANIAHIQLGAVVCSWWCLFTASIYVMARIALTHRAGRCSNSCAFSQRIHRQSNEIAAFHGYTSQCRHTRRIAHDVSSACRNPQYAN